MTYPMKVHIWRFYEILFSHIPEVGGTFITGCVFFAVLLREPAIHTSLVVAVINIAAITAVFRGSVDTSDELAIPMAIGYFMALGWRFVCFILDVVVISKLGFIQKGHKLLREDMLINGLFLIGSSVTIMASNEGSIFLILLLAYRHHPKAVLLILPAVIPHVLKLVGVPLFAMETLIIYDLHYHPAFYAGLIYLWGLFSSTQVGQITMRVLIYGLTPAILYLPTSPLELYSGYALLIFSSARFVPYTSRKVIPSVPVAPIAEQARDERRIQNQRPRQYNLRNRKQ
uniref:EpsG family protein n=2 Tax=Caenorhabditis tropicalis TaxID=1561998 RepID=A0A1I7T679_9PELO